MGLIVHDYISLKIGLSKSECFFNISSEPIILNKNLNISGFYNISVTFCIFFDHNAYIQGGTPIDKKKLTVTVSSQEINQNLYNLLYEKLKIDYESYVNM